MARILTDGGLLHVATDWAQYVEHTEAVLAESDAFVAERAENLCHNRLAQRVTTKFERRGRRLGHDIVDLYYRRIARSAAENS